MAIESVKLICPDSNAAQIIFIFILLGFYLQIVLF